MGRSDFVERIAVHSGDLFYQEHLARYEFARSHMRPGLTLDIACGTGYGTELLSRSADVCVIGADVHLPALVKARNEFADRWYIATSGTALPFASAVFDNVVTLETIEHIQSDEAYLGELARVLQPGGTCILSTPDRLYSERHNLTNPFHVREYSETELLNLLGRYFGEVTIHRQGFSREYHDQVSAYAVSIQTRKRQMNWVLQLAIEHAYRPLRRRVPHQVVNFFIRRLLRLPYPQPKSVDITISREPVTDASNFVVVARYPGRASESRVLNAVGRA